jgi:hypothetical protein
MRLCKIDEASVVDLHDRGDGTYGLMGITGTPQEIGDAVAAELTSGDMYQGGRMLVEDDGAELYLTVRIRFTRCAESERAGKEAEWRA